ncbi:MAG TPA: hypothetical protein EYP46_03660 [Hadesarchaea archaeon]|nr:hypothetical protein [Hadesarchaea archaeon]
MKPTRLTPPLSEPDIRKLRTGDLVSITGKIVTARDKAYTRAISDAKLPVKLQGGIVYHCGPLAKRTPSGWKVVSAGPTTSARMDQIQAKFVKLTGVRALIGKGGVGEKVAGQLARLGCVYLAFPGGTGALAAKSVAKIEGVFWRDLGIPEALWVLRVRDFGPLVVAIDTRGDNIYLDQKRWN